MANLTFSLHFHHMKDKIMEGFLYKYCPLGIIFSTAFSSIQVDVEDATRWLHSYRHSIFSQYLLSIYYMPGTVRGTYWDLLQPSKDRHCVFIKLTALCVSRKGYAWTAHIALCQQIKTSNRGTKFYSWICPYLPVSIGQVLSSLWAPDFSSVKNVMLTRIDDIYIPSSFNILRSYCPYATFTI